MKLRIFSLLMLLSTASCADAAPPEEAKLVSTQFTFFNFKNERVRVTVDGKTEFDRVVPAADPDWPNGFTAVAQIRLPPCANIVITTKRQRVAQRLCLKPTSKSVIVDGGPPVTITEKDHFQGDD